MKKVSPSNKIKNPFGSFFKNIFLGIAVFVLSLTMVSFINDNLNITKVSAQYNNVNKDNAGNVGMAIGDGESPLVSGDDGSLIWNIKDVAMSYYDFIYPVIGIDTQSFYDAGLLDDNTGATYFIDEEAFAGLAGGGALYDQTAQNDINSFGNSTAFYDGVYTYSNSLELMSFYNYTSQDTDINALYVNWGHKLYNPVMAYVNSQGEASGLGQSVYGYSLFPSYGFSYSSSNGGMLEPIDGTRLDMTLRNPFTAADAANALLDSDEQTSYYDYTSNNIGGGYVHRAFQNFAGVDENHTYDYILDLSADWAGNVASEFYRNYTYWDNDFDFIRTFFAGRSNHNIDAQEKIGIDFNMLGLYEQSSYNSFVKGDDDETDMGLGCVRGHVLGFLNAQTGSMWVVTLGAKGNDSSEVVPGTEANNRILNNYINFTDPDGFNYCRIRIGNYTRNYPVDEPDQIVRALNLSGVLSEKDIIVDDSVVMVIAPLVNANSLYISDEGSQASVSQSRMSYFVFGKSLTSDAIFEPQVLGGYESGPNNATNIVTSVQGLIDLEYSGLSCVSGTDNSSIKWTPLNWIYLIKDIVTTDDPARNGTSVFTVGFSTNEVEIATSAGLPPLPFDCPPIFLCGYCVATVGGSLIPQFVNNDQGEYVSDLLNEWIVSVTLPPACSVITFHLGVGTINIGSVKYSTYTIPVLENESITLNYSDYDDCSCSYSYDNTTTNLTFMGWGINTPTPTDSSDIWSSGTYLVTGNMGLELYAIWHTSSSISGNGITGYKTSAAGTITVETYAYTGTAGTTYTSTATFYEAIIGTKSITGYFSYDFGYSSSSLSSWNRAFVSGSQYYKCDRTGYGFNSGTGTSTDEELSSMTARWYLSNCPSLSGYNLLGFYESTTINDSTLFNRTSRSLTYSASSNSFKHVIIYSKTITAHFSEVDIDGNNSTTLNGTATIKGQSVGTGLTKTLYTQLYYKDSLVQKYTINDETVTNIAYVVDNTTNYKGIYYGTNNDAVTCYDSGNGSLLSETTGSSGSLDSIWDIGSNGDTYYFFFVHSADAQQTEYTINFYATSTTSVYNTASVVEGLTYSMPTTPTLDGYTFVGWSEANDYTAEWTSGTQTCSAAKNWYVVWSKTTDGDVTDGSEITVTMKATSSVTYTASQKKQQQTTGIVTNYNCNLSNSNVTSSGTVQYRLATKTNTSSATTTFASSYTTGSWSTTEPAYSLTVYYPQATLSGYTLVGWSDANDCAAEWTSGTQTSSATKNWYAVWSKTADGNVTDVGEITVTINATGSVTYTASQKKQQQATGTVTNYNYDLSNSNVASSGTVQYRLATKTNTSSATTTFASSYTTGSWSTTEPAYSLTVYYPQATLTGYTLHGYATSAVPTTANTTTAPTMAWTSGTTSKSFTSSTEYYSVYKRTLTYYYNNTSGTDTRYYPYNSTASASYNLTASSTVASGYTFAGYTTSANQPTNGQTGAIETESTSATIATTAANTTVYQATKKTWTFNDTSSSTTNVTTYYRYSATGAQSYAKANPSNSGYTFVGYSANNDTDVTDTGDVAAESSSTTVSSSAESVTFYAVWSGTSSVYFVQTLSTTKSIAGGSSTFGGTTSTASNQSKTATYYQNYSQSSTTYATYAITASANSGYTYRGLYYYASDSASNAYNSTYLKSAETSATITNDTTATRYYYFIFTTDSYKLTINYYSMSATNSTNITIAQADSTVTGSPISSPTTNGSAYTSATVAHEYSTTALTITIARANTSYAYYIKVGSAQTTNVAANNSTTTTWTPTSDSTINVYVYQVYTVTYNQNGATSISATSASKLHGVTLALATITRTGGTVVGWNTSASATSSTYASGANYTANANATLYAVTYVTYTGTLYSTSTSTAQATKSVNVYNTNTSGNITLETPTSQDGWTTLGWRDDTTAGAKEFDSTGTASLTGNKSFYAVYSRTVTVSYNGNGSTSGSTDASTGTQYRNVATNGTTEVTTAANGFTKTGYTFSGNWGTTTTGGTLYAAGTGKVTFSSSANTSGSVTLYAQWTAKNTNGVSITAKSLTYNGSAQTLVDVSNPNSITIYYSLTSISNAQSAQSTTIPTGINAADYTVYWYAVETSTYASSSGSVAVTINQLAVTYKADSTSKVYDGTALTLATATLTSGSLVSGHTASFSITGTITNVGSVTNTLNSVTIKSGSTDVTSNYLITKQNGTLTVTAKPVTISWSASTFTYNGSEQYPTASATGVTGETISFSYSFEATSGSLTTGKSVNVGSYTVTATPAVSGGQALASNYSFTATTQNYTITAKKATIGTISNVTIDYPKETTKTVIVTYDGDGTLSVSSSATDVVTAAISGTTITLTAKALGESTITVSASAGTNYSAPNNVTFKVTVSGSTYTVTLTTNGGTINSGNVTSYTYGTGATLPTNVTKTGYTFAGWFTTSALTGTAVTTISTTDSGDKTFYAKWNAIEYTITYNVNGGTSVTNNTYTIEDATITLSTTTKTGYTFVGWKVTSVTANTVYKASGSYANIDDIITQVFTGSHGDITVEAQWTTENCTLKITVNIDSSLSSASSYGLIKITYTDSVTGTTKVLSRRLTAGTITFTNIHHIGDLKVEVYTTYRVDSSADTITKTQVSSSEYLLEQTITLSKNNNGGYSNVTVLG